MSETQPYKISYETRRAALFALHARLREMKDWAEMEVENPKLQHYVRGEIKVVEDAIRDLENQ